MTLVATHTQRALDVLGQRYHGLRLIAEGRSGLVFTGHVGHEAGRPVAVKVAYPADGSVHFTTALARFRRECEIGARLSHPHIVRTWPSDVLDGIEFYEMDAAGPVRLDQLITAQNPPGFARILVILEQIADAMDYAHSHGIVHGALRPSTVLLDPTGNVLVKGFCLYRDEEPTLPALAPAAVGNAAYMAPEQWHDTRCGRLIDVYAVGVMAYELCTGHARVGYDAAGVPEIRPIELAPNHALRADVPMHVTVAIRRATNKDPDVRYASVGEFVRALSHPDEATGHSLPTLAPPLRAKPHAPGMLVALVLLVAAAIFFGVPSTPRDLLIARITAADSQ
jgi:eukaryotic-like serine/threonine-protein kinase